MSAWLVLFLLPRHFQTVVILYSLSFEEYYSRHSPPFLLKHCVLLFLFCNRKLVSVEQSVASGNHHWHGSVTVWLTLLHPPFCKICDKENLLFTQQILLLVYIRFGICSLGFDQCDQFTANPASHYPNASCVKLMGCKWNMLSNSLFSVELTAMYFTLLTFTLEDSSCMFTRLVIVLYLLQGLVVVDLVLVMRYEGQLFQIQFPCCFTHEFLQ